MRAPIPHRSSSRRRLRSERGFAVPTVLLMMVAAFAIVGVAVTASIDAQRGTVRDQSSKEALAVAEAGVTKALLIYNGGLGLTTTAPCLTPVTNPPNTVQPRAVEADGWCAPVEGSGGGGTFSYQICPNTSFHACAGEGTIEIASTGTYNGVTRRVDVVASSAAGSQVFLDAGIKSQNDIVMDSNAEIHSATSAGGSITLGSTSTKLCGLATVGPDGTAAGSGTYSASEDCAPPLLPLDSVGEQEVVLPPVDQGEAATINDNCRITAAKSGTAACAGDATKRDTISGSPNNVVWDPAARRLDLTGQSTTLTLTGTTYSFCRLTMSQNSAIYVQAGEKVNIFFDSPEACGLPGYDSSTSGTKASTAQMYLQSNTRIAAGSGQALAIYFVGSPPPRPPGIRSGVLMSSNSDGNAACVQNFVIYGPFSEIELNSNSTYCGAIAGESIKMNSNARFYTNDAAQSISLPGAVPRYVINKFVDCSAAPASPPNAGC